MPKRTNSACSRPGNETQHARLIAPFDLGLEPDEAVVIAGQIVLPQLHGGVGLAARSADRRDRPASSARSAACRRRGAPSPRSAGSPRRTAPCRNRGPSPTPRARARRRTARIRRASAGSSGSRRGRRRLRTAGDLPRRSGDPLGFTASAGAPVRPQTAIPARLAEHPGTIDCLGQDNRADRVVEVQVVAADKSRDVGREASEVSGPVATITGAASLESGIEVTSSRTMVMSGWSVTASRDDLRESARGRPPAPRRRARGSPRPRA